MAFESSFDRSAGGCNWPALFAVVFCAVTAGNLASSWIATRIAAVEARAALEAMEKSRSAAAAAAAQRQAAQVDQRLQRDRLSRLTDATATRLGRDCDDWSAADSKLRTPTTRAEANKRCDAYQRYVDTGELPR